MRQGVQKFLAGVNRRPMTEAEKVREDKADDISLDPAPEMVADTPKGYSVGPLEWSGRYAVVVIEGAIKGCSCEISAAHALSRQTHASGSEQRSRID
jgi:hypothetical protein